MRALAPVLALALLLTFAPPAAAIGSIPSGCMWLTLDDEVCWGENEGCTGVVFRNDIAGQFRCVGIYDRPIDHLLP